MVKRKVDILILSDIHLGTYGCHATELLQYLHTIEPKKVILNGDIIDIWQFSKRYWPAAHMRVIQHIIGYTTRSVPVYYIPGNHDEMLRRFKGFNIGSLEVVNKLSLKIDGSRVWIFHGDAFDVVMQHSRWLARLGAVGYDSLILINSLVNFVLMRLGKGKISLSARVKNRVKSAVKFINGFEKTVCTIAAENKYQRVICGHIHHATIKDVPTDHGNVVYMNSGDWVESLTALEYTAGEWRLYNYRADTVAQNMDTTSITHGQETAEAMMASLLREMKMAEYAGTEA